MSVKLMSRIWDEGPPSQAERFVLLAIADNASDAGVAYPSIASLARKTCMTERGIQKILRRLEAGGWLFTDAREGRKNCNLYTIFAAKKGVPDPEQGSLNPEHGSPQRGSLDPEHGSPEPSLTTIGTVNIKEADASLMKAREKPPRTLTDDEWAELHEPAVKDDGYAELKRRYVPTHLEDIITH
jgi:DNA-binding transcriptional MocR family regulator